LILIELVKDESLGVVDPVILRYKEGIKVTLIFWSKKSLLIKIVSLILPVFTAKGLKLFLLIIIDYFKTLHMISTVIVSYGASILNFGSQSNLSLFDDLIFCMIIFQFEIWYQFYWSRETIFHGNLLYLGLILNDILKYDLVWHDFDSFATNMTTGTTWTIFHFYLNFKFKFILLTNTNT